MRRGGRRLLSSGHLNHFFHYVGPAAEAREWGAGPEGQPREECSPSGIAGAICPMAEREGSPLPTSVLLPPSSLVCSSSTPRVSLPEKLDLGPEEPQNFFILLKDVVRE